MHPLNLRVSRQHRLRIARRRNNRGVISDANDETGEGTASRLQGGLDSGEQCPFSKLRNRQVADETLKGITERL